jgi:hypothetical protein
MELGMLPADGDHTIDIVELSNRDDTPRQIDRQVNEGSPPGSPAWD